MEMQKPRLVRVSYGSAVALEIRKGWVKVEPTTIYLLTYLEERCTANCAFCPQAREASSSLELLSRIEWPPHPVEKVVEASVEALRRKLMERACIQVINRPEGLAQALWLVENLSLKGKLPVSASIPPLNLELLRAFKHAGASRISIALDAATKEIFDRVKGSGVGGPYMWREHWEALKEALKTFGPWNVSTHLIIGLGETEGEVACTIEKLVSMKILPALFAFTPIPRTRLETNLQPSIDSYRRIQLIRHLLVKGVASLKDLVFNSDGRLIDISIPKEVLMEEVEDGEPFKTTGCPGCNRPFYNERVLGPIYNYPRPLTREEVEEALSQLNLRLTLTLTRLAI